MAHGGGATEPHAHGGCCAAPPSVWHLASAAEASRLITLRERTTPPLYAPPAPPLLPAAWAHLLPLHASWRGALRTEDAPGVAGLLGAAAFAAVGGAGVGGAVDI